MKTTLHWHGNELGRIPNVDRRNSEPYFGRSSLRVGILIGFMEINIFLGICIIWVMWKITQLLQMEMLSTILGQFIGAGMFALIVVFQQEIRKFLLMIGSTNIGRKTGLLKHIKFLQDEAQDTSKTKVEEIIDACDKMGQTRTGQLIVI